MLKLKRKAAALLVTLLVVALAGCGDRGRPLPEGMDENTVLDRGREVVALLTDGEYETVIGLLRADVAESVDATDLKTAMADAAKAGDYVEETDAIATGRAGKEKEPEYAEAVIFAKHSKKNVRYRIVFDQDMVLVGLEIRKI